MQNYRVSGPETGGRRGPTAARGITPGDYVLDLSVEVDEGDGSSVVDCPSQGLFAGVASVGGGASLCIMARWGWVACLGIVLPGCGNTTSNGEPAENGADSARSTGGASSTGFGGGSAKWGAAGQASGVGGDRVSVGNDGALGTSGNGAASGCVSPTRDLPDLEGQEYLVDAALLDQPLHLRFGSATTATLTRNFGDSETLDVVRGTCDMVEAVRGEDGIFELVGPILLNTAEGNQRLALSQASDGGVGDQAIVNQPVPCYAPLIAEASVEPDLTPTEARAEPRPYFDHLIPWEPIMLSVSKPPGAPLSESIVVSAAGNVADFEMTNESQLSMVDWSSLFGTTLEISADIVSTNGVTSPFTVDLPVVDLEPTPSPLDTTTWAGDGATLLGESATFIAPGTELCPDGCLSVGSVGGTAFALTGVRATTLVLHHRGGALEPILGGEIRSTTSAALRLAVPGSAPETHAIGSVTESTATEFRLPRAIVADEVVYGVVTGPSGKLQTQPGDGCNLSDIGGSVQLERIELSE